jgi:hypothetical protein
MGDKIRAAESKMSCVDAIGEARRMSDYLLHREFRGPGDTIEAAAYRVEQRWGAPATIIQRLRHRDVTDMLLSNWWRLRAAYQAACEAQERQADHAAQLAREAGVNETNSRLFTAATHLARSTGAPE